MRRLLFPLLVFLICLPVALLAVGVEIPWLRGTSSPAEPEPVPAGDREVAWLNTTTSAGTWERFVAGAQRAALSVPGMTIDDSRAFLDGASGAPEVIVGMEGRPGRIHIRWYKISSDARVRHWVEALAGRDPAPLAIIGGGSSDRARDLASALTRQTTWHGDRPLLFLTTATAETVAAEPGEDAANRADALGQIPLVRVYDGRTFRFCFGNRQMAEAMLDFVWDRPELRPQLFQATAPLAVGSGLLATRRVTHRPSVFYVDWNDDPYSSDLLAQFQDVLPQRLAAPDPTGARPARVADIYRWQVPFSVGGYTRPNRAEAEAAELILTELWRMPPQRSVLVIPTVAAPARRLLRALCEADSRIAHQLVALNGDGIGVNTILRDGEYAWPVSTVPVPLVLFTHNNPVGWDEPNTNPQPPPGSELRPPTSTEDVLHFAELVKVLVESAYPPTHGVGPIQKADELAARIRTRTPAFFDADGNRLGGTGEFVVLFKPTDPGSPDRGRPDATLEVWRRADPDGWRMTRSLAIDQSQPGRIGE